MSKRRSSAELKRLLIDAGLRVLYRNGLRATGSHVPMTEAIAELAATHGVDVGMGSIFGKGRLWANVGEFQIDLLVAAVDDDSGGGPNDSSLALIHAYLEDLTDRPLSERMRMMMDLCRIAGSVNGYVRPEVSKGRTWDLWVGIWATAMTAEDASDRLLPALHAEVARTNESFSAVYEVMLSKLGLRVRAPYTLDHLATLAAAMTDGIALRSAIDPGITDLISCPDDETSWNLLGVGFAAITSRLLEDDVPSPT